MNIFLGCLASDWTGKQRVACKFEAWADKAPLPLALDTTEQSPVFEIPGATVEVMVKATPILAQGAPASPFWDNTVTLQVASGTLIAKTGSEGFVALAPMPTLSGSSALIANIFLSWFKDASQATVDQLKSPPSSRYKIVDWKRETWGTVGSGEPANHEKFWQTWPPANWDLPNLSSIPFIDTTNPVQAGALMFNMKDLQVKATNVVLQLAAVDTPQLFGVTWPNAIKPTPGIAAVPMPFLVFFEQTLQTNFEGSGIFVGPGLGAYPTSFDYSDMLYQQMHYEDDAPFSWMFAKGVPYQVAQAGANVVTVVPLNSYDKEFGVINDTEQLGKILVQLQAFMYMLMGGPQAPTTLGKVGLAAFSSATHVLHKLLQSPQNRSGDFLDKTVKAVYFIDPPRDSDPAHVDFDVNAYIKSALAWQGDPGVTNKRIRLYMRMHSDAHGQLLGTYDSAKGTMAPKSPPSAPYVQNSADGLRTAAELPPKIWSSASLKYGGLKIPADKDEWLFAHHMFAATLLTHALAPHPPAQHDLG